jgi:hypothetical protein
LEIGRGDHRAIPVSRNQRGGGFGARTPQPHVGVAVFSQALSELADAPARTTGEPWDVAVDAGTEPRKRETALASASGGDVARTAAKATAAAVVVVAIAFGLWKVRSIIIILLLALTFAAAIRPGVEWRRPGTGSPSATG